MSEDVKKVILGFRASRSSIGDDLLDIAIHALYYGTGCVSFEEALYSAIESDMESDYEEVTDEIYAEQVVGKFDSVIDNIGEISKCFNPMISKLIDDEDYSISKIEFNKSNTIIYLDR